MEVPQLTEGTVNMLLLLGERAAADPALLAQLARLLTHTLLRATVLLAAAASMGEGHRRLHLVRSTACASSDHLAVRMLSAAPV